MSGCDVNNRLIANYTVNIEQIKFIFSHKLIAKQKNTLEEIILVELTKTLLLDSDRKREIEREIDSCQMHIQVCAQTNHYQMYAFNKSFICFGNNIQTNCLRRLDGATKQFNFDRSYINICHCTPFTKYYEK